ncbi:hypothetical protein [Tellurirhabdus rosea]|uniref:hypothetical protein n=1 Tax=Tellurirhabdus rosea TaxID=2674997 RepID=UPI00225219C8|nr:hypothetical protein [Tellurirhabdus rosea]
MDVLSVKIGIALFLSVAVVLLLWLRKYLNRFSESQHGSLIALFFVFLRVIPFVLVYLVLGLEPRSDVPVFFDAALQASRGQVVYRDFWSPYSPLFAYMTALPVLFWQSAKAVVALMILMEGLALWLTWRFYRPLLGRDALIRVLVYLMLPGPLVLCVLGGQEDIWMWLFVVISALVWQRTRNSFWVGVVMALALITTKALAVLLVVSLFFLVERPFKYLAGLLLVGIPSFALLVWLVGEKFLTPLMFADMPFAPNLWTVVSPIIGDFRPYAKTLSWVGLAATMGVACLAAAFLKQKTTYEKALPVLFSLCFSFMMFFHKSSFSNYAFIFMMPFVLGILNLSSRRQLLALLLFNAAVVVQPTYWWGLGTPVFTNWAMVLTPRHLIEYGMELTVVGCLVYFLVLLYRNLVYQPGRLGSV